jgi:surfeit locus 1 family protein
LNIAGSGKAKPDYAPADSGVPASARPRRFAPAAWPTVAALAFVALFIAAGNWQWQKAEIKEAKQRELERGLAANVVTLTAAPVDADALAYRRVSARGTFEPQGEILIDNRVHNEQAGYHVVTPLRLAGSETRVLVNRGWIPAPNDRSVLPQVDTPGAPVEITGVAVVPPKRFFTLGAAQEAGRLWQHLDLERYARAATFPVPPIVVLLDEKSVGGFVRDWRRADERIFTNRGYALQWWAFAATTAALWLVFSFRRARAEDAAR